jgi:hypothetical protein
MPAKDDVRREFALAEDEYLDLVTRSPIPWDVSLEEALNFEARLETVRRHFREVKSWVAELEVRDAS